MCGRPWSSVSEDSAFSRSRTRWQTLEGWPSQMGVAISRMSAARTFSRRAGQASPSPSSTSIPGRTSWSATRTTSPGTSCRASCAMCGDGAPRVSRVSPGLHDLSMQRVA
ncbi:hypothetical protein TK78_31720 [Streptomyces sp. Tue 6075]|nr:hypothetical protein TK78_31720 [Streptomyces sp. Tue 6075]